MSWVALSQPAGAVLHPDGRDNRVLALGTLALEWSGDPTRGRQMLVDHRSTDPWVSSLSVVFEIDGTLVLERQLGDAFFRLTLPTKLATSTVDHRVTFTWDAPNRTARLSVVDLGTGRMWQTSGCDPLPISLAEIATLTQGQPEGHATFLSVADHQMFHGPQPGLSGQTGIVTPDGIRRISDISAGSFVQTADDGWAQVRARLSATLPNAGWFQPVRLRANFYGATRDLMCAPDARLLLDGSEVEYLFASEQVAVSVGDLAEGVTDLSVPGPTVTYHQLLLDRPAALAINGLAVEGFDCSGLRDRRAAHKASAVAAIPWELLPTKPHDEAPILRAFETRTLCALRAA